MGRNHHYANHWLSPLWWLTLALFAIACVAPFFTLHRLWIFDDTVSLLGGIWQLATGGEWLLFLLLLAFSILFPLAKLTALFVIIHAGLDSLKQRRWLQWLHSAGRWSMLDVFVVAVLVVAVKLKGIARIEIHYGLYLFGLSVLLSNALTWYLQRDSQRPD